VGAFKRGAKAEFMTADPQKLARLLEEFRSFDRSRAQAAEAQLIALGDEAVAPLCQMLQHPDDQFKSRAAQALGRMRHPGAVSALQQALQQRPVSASDDVRGVLARALADAAPAKDQALLTLFSQLAKRDPDLFVRASSIDALGRIGDATTRAALVAAQNDPEPWVKEAASRALATLDARAALELTAAIQGQPQPTEDAESMSLGKALREAPDAAARDSALDALVGRGFRALPVLLSLLGDPKKAVRLAAYRGLGRLRDRRAMPALITRAENSALDIEERALATRALAAAIDNRDVSLMPLLLRISEHEDRFMRSAAIAALVRIGTIPAQDAVLRSLDDPESFIRESTARSLAARADSSWPGASTRLVRAIRLEEDPSILSAMLRALAVVEAPPPLSTGQAWSVAKELLHHNHTAVRAASLSVALDHAPSGSQELAASLYRLLLDENREIRIAALRASNREGTPPIPGASVALRSFLADPERDISKEAIKLLGRIGDRGSVELLLSVLRFPDPELASYAKQMLQSLDPNGPIRMRFEEDGRVSFESILRCQKCSTEMHWTNEDASVRALPPASGDALPPPPVAQSAPPTIRRILRCSNCQTEHALARGERPVPISESPFGVCTCPSCPQKSLLIWQDDNLICPVSGETYVRPEGQTPTRVRDLSFGVCTCCGREAQPLMRGEGGHIVCPKTGREHTIRDGRYQAIHAAVGDVDAINRALLAGTLSLTQSGLPVENDGDDVL
jgi:HEAT repeat protein